MPELRDKFSEIQLYLEPVSLVLRVQGPDRPGIISNFANVLESYRLYIASITFNLVLPTHDQYEMEILVRGDRPDIDRIVELIQEDQFPQAANPRGAHRIHWASAYMFHIALCTPDREGLTARVAAIVGRRRNHEIREEWGNFVHLLGFTQDSDGPEGGAPYFCLRANVAARTKAVQEEIVADLEEWARKDGREGDLWIRDLNR